MCVCELYKSGSLGHESNIRIRRFGSLSVLCAIIITYNSFDNISYSVQQKLII